MANSEYPTVVGFIQFDPITRDVNGEQIREFTVNGVGFTGQPPVRVTLWSSHEGVEVAKGDFVAVQGKYSQRESKGTTYHNLNAYDVVVLKAAGRKATEGVVRKAQATSKAPF